MPQETRSIVNEFLSCMMKRARGSLINLLCEMNLTMLVSTHDMRLVEELFPRTVVMDGGQIVADDLTGEILNDESLLEAHGLEKP